jgi:hypothetical protein
LSIGHSQDEGKPAFCRTNYFVTADLETGGMVVLDGIYETGIVKGEFTTGGHTAT